MGERVWRMLVKEFIQVLRDPLMRAMIFAMPLIQQLMFGYAVTTDVEQVRTAVLDMDRSSASRALVDRIEASGYFDIVARPDDARALTGLLDRGEVTLALQLDAGFADALARGQPALVQTLVDGTDSTTGTVAMDYMQRIVAAHAQALAAEAAGGSLPWQPVELRSRAWFNPALESRVFNVPGVIAAIVLLTSLLLTAMAIVREREIGTLEQLMVTPIRPLELILGKTLPFVVIAYVNVLLVTAVGVVWFGIPIVGSFALLLAGAALYLMSTVGVGLFISTVSRTQQQALMSSFFFYLPAVLLSGFMFPIANMPEPAQWVTYLNPLRYFLVVIRGIFLEGAGIDVLWPQFAALALLGTALLTASVMRFGKRLA